MNAVLLSRSKSPNPLGQREGDLAVISIYTLASRLLRLIRCLDVEDRNMTENTKPEFWRWTETNWVNQRQTGKKRKPLPWDRCRFVAPSGNHGGRRLVYCLSGNMRTGCEQQQRQNGLNFALEKTDMPRTEWITASVPAMAE